MRFYKIATIQLTVILIFNLSCNNYTNKGSQDSLLSSFLLFSTDDSINELTLEFKNKVEAGCPCVMPDMETDVKYMLSNDELDIIDKYHRMLEEKDLNDHAMRKEYALLGQNIYTKAHSDADNPVENYMIDILDNIQDHILPVSTDGLKSMRNILTLNIIDLNTVINNFNTEFNSQYHEFIKAELKMLIQIRRAVIDELEKR